MAGYIFQPIDLNSVALRPLEYTGTDANGIGSPVGRWPGDLMVFTDTGNGEFALFWWTPQDGWIEGGQRGIVQ
jgi:hypothetical protein